jgi:hypothetical protein
MFSHFISLSLLLLGPAQLAHSLSLSPFLSFPLCSPARQFFFFSFSFPSRPGPANSLLFPPPRGPLPSSFSLLSPTHGPHAPSPVHRASLSLPPFCRWRVAPTHRGRPDLEPGSGLRPGRTRRPPGHSPPQARTPRRRNRRYKAPLNPSSLSPKP